MTTTTTTQPANPDVLREEYNAAPYESFPFPQSHPARMYTLGKLFGLKPQPIENAKILELGCAGGGNIIPLAYHFPTAEILGIDLADKQIEEGITQILALNLKNIHLRQQSIADFGAHEGQFDYIICHGVYSWVDKDIQQKILAICKNHLTPQGIAYISYNTFPGWTMVNGIRDLMRWHTNNIQDPYAKAQQARAVLKFIAEGLQNETSAYAQVLRNELNLLSQQRDSYLLHEHLSTFNTPIYFHQFVEAATQHGLSYLSDTQLDLMFTDNLPNVFSNELKKINNIFVQQQYIDFIRNQRFRCSLLCQQDVKVNRSLNADQIEQFYLQLVAVPTNTALSESDLGEGKEIVFSHNGMNCTARNFITQMALLILHQERNKPIHYNTLCQKIMEKTGIQDQIRIKCILNTELNLMRLVLAGLLQISTQALDYNTTVSDKPIACSLARVQSTKTNHVTNLYHHAVNLSPLANILIQYLDGKHDKKALLEIAKEKVKSGVLHTLDANRNPITEEEQQTSELRLAIERELLFFAQQGLLLPEATAH